MMSDKLQSGVACSLVFKAQAFAPSPNPDTRTVDMVLNVISGVYRGVEEQHPGVFMFETESANGVGVLWFIKFDDVLMLGVRCETSRLARH